MIPDVTSIATLGSKASPKDVAAKVQGMFMEVMLKSMEDSVGAEDGLFGNSATSDIYRGMWREKLAAQMTEKINSPLQGELDKALKKSAARAVQPAAQAVQPAAQAVQPAAQAVQPAAQAVQPAAQAVQPAAQAVQNDSSESDLPVSGVISSPQGWRRDPINGETRYHAGTDIAAPAGTPIKAVADGQVIESGMKGTYGNTVVVQTDDGRKMLYAHNNQNFVQVGDRVSRGEEIAEVGSTGRATGPHVHFEVKF
jgi:murein DD-endopeptidase MepM/ murein hydrolase activator NlpD